MWRTNKEEEYTDRLEEYFVSSCGTAADKLINFPKFVPRQILSQFIFKYELMKLILPCHGSIVECGVHRGGGTMTFANISSILEPYNYQRKIFGFDTFEGLVEVTGEDISTDEGRKSAKTGTFKVAGGIEEDLKTAVELYDMNRPLGHVQKVYFIKGDATSTIRNFLDKHPETVVSLLYLDFVLYKPTKEALKALISRIPKGGIIAFNELNNTEWPGETQAVNEILGLNKIRIQRFPFEPSRSFAVLD